jgi:hypothetical protein
MTLLHTRRLAAWIALAAMLLAALAPTVSRARAWAGAPATGWIEICTVSGMQWVRLAGSQPLGEPAPAPAPGLDGCPFCLLLADRLGPPSPPPAPFGRPGDPPAPVFTPAPERHAHIPQAALARGPPPLNTALPFVA